MIFFNYYVMIYVPHIVNRITKKVRIKILSKTDNIFIAKEYIKLYN